MRGTGPQAADSTGNGTKAAVAAVVLALLALLAVAPGCQTEAGSAAAGSDDVAKTGDYGPSAASDGAARHLPGHGATPGDLPADPAASRLAWAHHTPWHTPTNSSFTPGDFMNYPTLRPTGDVAADWRAEFAEAKASGIDGFFVDLVGSAGKSTVFVDALTNMLDAAKGSDFLVAPCLDGGYEDMDWQIQELLKILNALATHPNYPRLGGRPVVCSYSSMGKRTPEWWDTLRARLLTEGGYDVYLIGNISTGYSALDPAVADAYAKSFDMLFSFMENGIHGQSIADRFDLLAAATARHGHAWMPTVWPGYVGGWLNGRNDFYQPHFGFDQIWDCYAAMKPGRGAWIHFTTWNDLDETPFQPTVFEYGALSEINQALIARWRGEATTSDAPRIYLAYHREEIVGTVCRIEALSLPGTVGGPATETAPGANPTRYIDLSGHLEGPDGQVIAELPTRRMDLDSLSRAEWAVPSAAFAGVAAVTPVITAKLRLGPGSSAASAELYRNWRASLVRLPDILPVTGWLQNQTTVRVPLHAMVTAATADAALQVQQDGSRLTAGLTVRSEVPVVHAELWRNDRPITPFQPAPVASPTLNLEFHTRPGVSLDVALSGAELQWAERKFGPSRYAFSYSADTLKAASNYPWTPVAFVVAAPDLDAASLTLTRPGVKDASVATTLAALLRQETLELPGGPGTATLRLSDFDVRILQHPPLAPVPANAGAGATYTYSLHAALWSRDAQLGDRFQARLETADGRVFFSPVATPFADASPPRRLVVVQTAENLETPSNAAGMPGRPVFLSTPPFTTPEYATVNLHPANARAGRWTFDAGPRDDWGDRPLQNGKSRIWTGGTKFLKPLGPDGSPCLVLGGSDSLKLRARAYPMTACTIALDLYPTGDASAPQTVLTRGGWTVGFTFTRLPDDRVEVRRDAADRVPETVFVSDRPLPRDAWTRLHLNFDGRDATLYFGAEPVGRQSYPPAVQFGNCTPIIGAGKDGFVGRVDNLVLLGYPSLP